MANTKEGCGPGLLACTMFGSRLKYFISATSCRDRGARRGGLSLQHLQGSATSGAGREGRRGPGRAFEQEGGRMDDWADERGSWGSPEQTGWRAFPSPRSSPPPSARLQHSAVQRGLMSTAESPTCGSDQRPKRA